MELRVGGRFRLGRKIGSGSFGDIYLGKIASFKIAFSFLIIANRGNNELIINLGVNKLVSDLPRLSSF